jgi:hypothetical protein
MSNRLRRTVAVASAATIALFGVACSDDDNDGNPEVEAPEVTSPDVDVDGGEMPDVDVEGGEMPDVDVNEDNDGN